MTPELKAAYERLEAAITEVGHLEGFEGVLTEWVIVAACQRYDEDGDGITQIARILPHGGGATPFHHIMGLLDYALTRCRSEANEWEEP